MSASALVCLAPGSEETEAVTTIDLLVRGGIKVTTASVASDGNLAITCSRGVKLLADAPLVEVADGEYDVIVLPGGIKGAECFRDSTLLVETVKQFHRSGRIVAAICASHRAGPARYLPDWQYDRLPNAERQNSRRTMAGQARRLGCTGKIADQPGAGYSYRLWSENYRPAGWARESP
jgi:4-methyl-5(b-hydroxyethyl)-thiazole monophosphate biosynthesis